MQNLFKPPTEKDLAKREAIRIKNCRHEYARFDLIVDNSGDVTKLSSGIRCPDCEKVFNVQSLRGTYRG